MLSKDTIIFKSINTIFFKSVGANTRRVIGSKYIFNNNENTNCIFYPFYFRSVFKKSRFMFGWSSSKRCW